MENVEIKERIVEELQNMGFNFAHCGTTYLVDAIHIIYTSEDLSMMNCIEKKVYILIAEKYDKKESTIKSNIIKATNYVHELTIMERKKTSEYYNVYPKITPKSVINTVMLKIKN